MRRHWRAGFWALVLAYAALLAWLLPHRYWGPDEFEHVQAAWLISQGLTPYRDFFEHHTPLWHLLAAPILGVASPEEHAMALLARLRFLSLAFSAGIAALTWWLACRLGGGLIAICALALLLTESTFIGKAIEIRPDSLSTLGIVGIACILAGILAPAAPAAGPASPSAPLRMALAGAAGAVAILASQKALFAGPGLVAAFLWLAVRQAGWRRALMLAAAGAAGAMAVAAPVLAWFAARGALGAFIQYNFLLNARWARQDSDLLGLLTPRYDGAFLLLAALGLVMLAVRIGRADRPAAPLLVVALPLVSLIGGAFALPVVQYQYVLMALPFAAICGAVAADRLIRAARRILPAGGWAQALPAAGFAAVILLVTTRNLELKFHQTDEYTRAKLAFVLRTVPPGETVLAGWSTGVAFRRPAWFYFFPHGEIREMLPPDAYRALAEGLRSGAIRPALVDLDHDLQKLPPEVLAEIRRLYEPAGVADLQRRRPDAGP